MNKEERREYNRKWYLENKERKKQEARKWRASNSSYIKNYYLLNKARVRKKVNEWFAKNPNYSKERYARLRLDNSFKELTRKRYIQGLPKREAWRVKNVYGLNLEEYKALTKACALCGFDSYRVDIHHIDYNRKNNTIENFIGLCPNCHQGIHRGKYKYTEEDLKKLNK